jgi:hypothetical protein
MMLLSEMQYPHWLMVAGAVLVVLGFIGFAFRQNSNAAPNEDNLKQATPSESIQAALEAEMKAKGK